MLRYCEERATLECSVRDLCALALRSGDLDRGAYRAVFSRMQEGAALHRELQAAMGPEYKPEVPFSHAVLCDGLTYTVSGRADGVWTYEDGFLCVHEIKSVSGGAFFMTPPDIFWAQLRCYAYFVCCQEDRPVIGLKLTYIQTDSHKLRHFELTETRTELEQFYLGLLKKIKVWGELAKERCVDIPAAVRSTHFPFSGLREGQEELMQTCHRAIRTGKRLFVQAPTGIGKTISTLYPAVRAIGEGRCRKIFYLTAKASTASEAFRAAGQIYRAGAPVRAIMLTAKEQACLCPGFTEEHRPLRDVCHAIDCPYAAGYYDRIDGALTELLSLAHGFSPSLITEVARRHSVCPYELSLDLSELCEVVIGDYNYVFDPAVRLRRYFGPDASGEGEYVFLVDEAHNLPDRAREIYSSTISNDTLEKLAVLFPATEEEPGKSLERLVLFLRRAKKLCRDTLRTDTDGKESGYYLSRAPIGGLVEQAQLCYRELDAWIWHNREHPHVGAATDVRDTLREFLFVAELYDEHFYTYLQVERGVTSVKLYCIDPSALLDRSMSLARSTILFSATLTPTDYFADVLGGGSRALQLTLPSPFDRENLLVAAVDSISTRFEDREKTYKKIVSCIAATVSGRVGNYLVYFPSYAYLERVREIFARKYPYIPLIVQGRNMSRARREAFLAEFADDDSRLRVGFCVLGGIFSEGVDLPGKRLIGTVIVGVGLPGLSNERNILRDYFDSRCERGYDYAYTYPGVNRVLQAAGRVIRTEEDRGVVVLIDDRYATPTYRSLFPEGWRGIKYTGNAISLAELVKRFWKSGKNGD